MVSLLIHGSIIVLDILRWVRGQLLFYDSNFGASIFLFIKIQLIYNQPILEVILLVNYFKI